MVLDGSGIGTTPETLLLDDVSLTLDGGPNLITNGDFSAGLGHWRPFDDAPGATRSLNSSDFRSSPQSFAWTTVVQAGEGRTAYDTTDTSEPFTDWPYQAGTTVWMAAAGGSRAELRFWYRYGGVGVRLHTLLPDGHVEQISDWWFDRAADWTEAVASQVLPADVLHGFEQQLTTSQEDGNLIIRDLLVKDYPIILRLTPTREVFLPVVVR